MNFNRDTDNSQEIGAAMGRVLSSSQWVNGPELAEFERDWAGYNGLPYAVGVGSGTDALRLSLLALGIKPGDTVISPAFNSAYTAQAVASIGAKNAYVDIDPDTMLIDPYDMRAHAEAKAIVPVHLFGQMCDMTSVVECARIWGLVVVEDAAQAHGACSADYHLPGQLSDAACFSHYPTKNLGCLGEGGSVVTHIPAVNEYVRLARDAGRTDRYIHQIVGSNSMLDEMQAAVLNVRLKYLDAQNKKRRALARIYVEGLTNVGDLRFQQMTSTGRHVYHLFVVRTASREGLLKYLKANNIPALSHYPCAVHHQPFARAEGLPQGSFPHSEEAAAQVLSLPLWPSMPEAVCERVVQSVRRFYGK